MSLTTRFKTLLSAIMDAADDYEGAIREAFPDLDIRWTDGNGDNQANAFYFASRDLPAATAENLDLTALTPGPNGVAVDMSGGVKLLAVHFPETNPGVIEIKPGATTPWLAYLKDATDIIQGQPGTTAYLIINALAGQYPVSAGAKLLNFNNLAASQGTYKILAIGAAS